MSTPPSGTVAFLFTDIEGSTRLAQEHVDEWESMRTRHDSILKAAVDENGGYVFQIIGDAFCAAFHTAGDAVRAAIQSQMALGHEQWGQSPLKVRMGIHIGKAEFHPDGQYHGYLTLSRVQRVMSVAYGGQVLLSNASAELSRGELPRGVTLQDLKEHRLKGLADVERLWQLVAPDLQQDFPPLQSLAEIPGNLPAQVTSFVGRESEIRQIKRRLEKNRLVTLTGTGGIGKTRLSMQVASELLTGYPYGAWLVELGLISDPALVTQAVCAALDLTLQGNRPALRVLTDYLAQKRLLLVVDNCEHLIEAAAQLCDSLLRSCPEVRILASSREALGVSGESVYHVPSLSLPSPGDGPGAVEQSEAVRLFVERATAAFPEFAMTETNGPAIAQICQRLDGIALAIELAAARVKILSVEQIAARLDDAFRLLTGGGHGALPRQKTLRALIDWSYNLLDDEERVVFQRLSVFAGGWTLEAAEMVCANTETLDVLTRLADKSLVRVQSDHGDTPRYYLLETIRQYARGKLAESGDEEAVRRRHLAWNLQLVQRAEPELYRSNQILWFNKLENEIDNLRAALDWALTTDPASGLRIAVIPWRFFSVRGFFQEIGSRIGQLLDRYYTMDRLHAQALAVYSIFFFRRGDFTNAIESASKGLKLARTLSDRQLEAFTLSVLGLMTLLRGNRGEGTPLLEKGLALYRAVGDKIGQANALEWLSLDHADLGRAKSYAEESLSLHRELNNLVGMESILITLGRLTQWSGDYASSAARLEEALSICRQLGDRRAESEALLAFATLAHWRGDYPVAIERFDKAMVLAEGIGDHYRVLWSYLHLAHTLLRLGDIGHAQTFLARGIEGANQGDFMIGLVYGIEGIASLNVTEAEYRVAVQLYAWADTMRARIGDHRPPVEQSSVQHDLRLIRSRIGDAALESAYSAGRAMTVEEAMALALKRNP